MRIKTIVLFLMIVLLIGLIGATTTAALAVFAPFYPGQSIFAVQSWAENRYEALLGTPSGQAEYGLSLLDHRIQGLEKSLGSPAELDVLISIADEIDQVLQRFKELPAEDGANLRAMFIYDLDHLLPLLDKTSSLSGTVPESLLDFRVKMLGLKAAAEYTSNPLAELSTSGFPPDEAPSAKGSVVGLVKTGIDPRIILFPPGSPGALHHFFPLDGKHAQLECLTCHPGGIYGGTPNLCTSCHAKDKPGIHFAGECALCHSTTAWLPSTFTHSSVDTQNCLSCHQSDRPVNHYQGQCGACHVTDAWLPANFDHQTAGAVDCQNCHAVNRPANHYGGQCSACHSTAGWLPATFNHEAAGAVDCQSCHSNSKPANHFGGQCSACHSTSGWLPASFNHAAAGATDCQACHGRPANHFAGQCSDCHSTSGWGGATFNHSFPTSHGGANGECAQCHPGGGSSWTCYTCHNEAELTKHHAEKEIFDIAPRCLECHSNGDK